MSLPKPSALVLIAAARTRNAAARPIASCKLAPWPAVRSIGRRFALIFLEDGVRLNPAGRAAVALIVGLGLTAATSAAPGSPTYDPTSDSPDIANHDTALADGVRTPRNNERARAQHDAAEAARHEPATLGTGGASGGGHPTPDDADRLDAFAVASVTGAERTPKPLAARPSRSSSLGRVPTTDATDDTGSGNLGGADTELRPEVEADRTSVGNRSRVPATSVPAGPDVAGARSTPVPRPPAAEQSSPGEAAGANTASNEAEAPVEVGGTATATRTPRRAATALPGPLGPEASPPTPSSESEAATPRALPTAAGTSASTAVSTSAPTAASTTAPTAASTSAPPTQPPSPTRVTTPSPVPASATPIRTATPVPSPINPAPNPTSRATPD